MTDDPKTRPTTAPSIDDLLDASNWEARLADARKRREKVLAAKAGGPPAEAAPVVRPEPTAEPTPPPIAPAPQRQRPVLMVAVIGILIGMIAGGLIVWAF